MTSCTRFSFGMLKKRFELWLIKSTHDTGGETMRCGGKAKLRNREANIDQTIVLILELPTHYGSQASCGFEALYELLPLHGH